MSIAVITTFGNQHWEVYAKMALQSFTQFWPAEIPLMVQLDDDLLHDQVKSVLRPQDAIAIGWTEAHRAFVTRNAGKDDAVDYRKMPVRFCHKVYSIKRAADAIHDAKKKNEPSARYLIWMDADVVTTSKPDLDACLPKQEDAVAYMGRKDWPHSECGWLAFDMENGGGDIIDQWLAFYNSDTVLKMEQQDDSWIFDKVRGSKCTNLTEGKPGMDIWPHSPMGKWSTHFKGPAAKAELMGTKQQLPPMQKKQMMTNIAIETKNALPNEKICDNIRINQLLIKNWIRKCKKNDEEIVIVSAGPQLVAEDVRAEEGKKIIAVKHALEPLRKAGVKPWACILLDPRDHVAKFVENPDKDILWLVASQVDPEATKRLLEAGCEVWGYHAAVGAGEETLTVKQHDAIVAGGSATATRGMYAMYHLGFHNFRLYGYDLCYPDKPKDMNEKDTYGQPKHLEVSVGFNHPRFDMKRSFWTEPQLLAQFEEINQIVREGKLNIKAFGNGIVPFIVKAKETGDLREKELRAKLGATELTTYDRMFKCSSKTKTPFLTKLRSLSPRSRRKTK